MSPEQWAPSSEPRAVTPATPPAVATEDRPARRAALLTVVVAGGVFLALAVWLVPWRPYSGGPLVLPDPAELFDAEHLARAEHFSGQARLWTRSSLVVSVLVAAVLGFTWLGRLLTDRLRGPWWLRTLEAVLALALVGRLATLPFSVMLRREQREAGLSGQPWRGFARDLLVAEAVSVVATALALLVLMLCVRRLPRTWPAVAGTLVATLVMLGSFVYPVLVEPLSQDFTSLPEGPLRAEILALAEAEEVRVDDVLVSDASRRTTTLNAYVSGYGSTRRVVVYDNLVAELPRDQVLAVVAHELAHAKHDDVLVGSLLGATGAAAAVGLLGLLAGRRRLGEADAVPWVLAVLALGSVLSTPLENLVSRQIETRADVVALEVTHDPEAFIGLQRQLSASALSDPQPAAWSQWWFGSHPTVLERIALARLLADHSADGSAAD